ncbi:MAG: diacylglycerol kinase family lipid kinase, partial [Lachnospiraceae bacterium]|nr:diacylglycerol kinase family lipid kinase [Lachnospiraceae bacterium]
MEKVLLILNGSAGKGKMRSSAYEIIEKICLKECLVTVLPISPDKGLDMADFPENEWEKYDRIICAGGDGTLNRTINAIMKKHVAGNVSLGYIPSGSTNDFARSIGLSDDVLKATEVAISGNPFYYDIGRFNDNYFNYVAAFGAFSAVSYSTSQEFKNALGHAAYILEGINRLPENIRFNIPMKIKTDVFEEEGNY